MQKLLPRQARQQERRESQSSQRVPRQYGQRRRLKLFARTGLLSKHLMRQLASNSEQVTATFWSKLGLPLISGIV